MTAPMRTFRLAAAALASTLLATGAMTAPLRAQDAAPAWTKVSYLSGAMVYLEAGSRDGLREGAHLTVVRGGVAIGELVVAFISSTRASCTRGTPDQQVVIGDSVRYIPAKVATVANGAARATGSAARSASDGYLRGRIGFRYLLLNPTAGSALAQPGIDARLDGHRMGGSPLSITIDVRAQRSSYTRPPGASTLQPGAEQTTRVYQAMVQYAPEHSPARLSLGRQFALSLSSVGMFDGVALDVDGGRWSGGAFAGQEPEPMSLGLSSLTREYGAWVQLHHRPGDTRLWSLTLGGVGAYASGQIDREFAFARLTYTDRRLSLYATQELDVNRGWKGLQERSATTPTATFVTAQLSLSNAVSLYAGMDNRRNVRLYRDYQTPEIVFDDSFRQGMWGGGAFTLFERLRLSTELRRSSGGTTGPTQSVTSAASVTRLTHLQMGVHLRTTSYDGPLSAGRLQSLAVELTPFGTLHLQYTAGMRESSVTTNGTTPPRIFWASADADIGIGRSFYFMLSSYRESSALDRSLQTYASVSYRF